MTNTPSATVLVVDDEQDVADLFASQLAPDYDVITAYGGEQAIDALAENDVDVVLLDRRMPGLSGDEVLAHIHDEGYECRVAMVTAVDPGFDIVEMPFDDYLTKPVSRDDVHEAVHRLLTLTRYDEQVGEFFALAQKIAALETEYTGSTLEDEEAYQRLRSRLNRWQDEVSETVSDLPPELLTAAMEAPRDSDRD